jgi:hypothetical protein
MGLAFGRGGVYVVHKSTAATLDDRMDGEQGKNRVPKRRGPPPKQLRDPRPAGPRCPARCMGGRVLGFESGSMSTLCPECGGSGEMLLSPAALSE